MRRCYKNLEHSNLSRIANTRGIKPHPSIIRQRYTSLQTVSWSMFTKQVSFVYCITIVSSILFNIESNS